jgi:hypothetical protein
MSNIMAIIIVAAVAITIIVMLIRKNQKDKKLLNPDAQDSAEGTRYDHYRVQLTRHWRNKFPNRTNAPRIGNLASGVSWFVPTDKYQPNNILHTKED